jgi:MoaA/NifB/PqqE/SkfB family radical SAM enzyme
MANNKSLKHRQFVQPGLGTTTTKAGGELRSIWIETPGWCDLYCQYCFAATRKIDRDPNNLALEEYRRLIKSFAEMGGRDIGIPGSGEPFHRDDQMGVSNCRLTLDILDCCKEAGLCLTIFTTGHWIDAALAERLRDYDVVLLIKYNSMDEKIQNTLVGINGKNPQFNYAQQRDHALLLLMAMGFNEPAFGKKSRLGIVTSVMNANKHELPMLLRFARRHNLIFDCDTILERGRGKSFDETGGSPPDNEMREIFRTLQRIDAEEFGNQWHISRSYIGTCCDRFRHHLYVSKTGDVHPCVGATTVHLGNIRTATLRECWDAPAMMVIRNHKYTGKCTECLNFKEEKCYSCLGRCTANLNDSQIETDGCVRTIGCWNNRPSLDDDPSYGGLSNE